MKHTKQARREAKQLFRSCVVDGLLNEERVRQALQLVTAQRPRGFLPILDHFQRLVKLDLERRTGRVESAVPLNSQTQTELRDRLEQRYGPGLNLSFTSDPSLVGGMKVRVGSDVYDGSVRGRLAALQETL